MRQTELQKGFSLIELMVTIGIIGLLASIVVTSLASARKNSHETARRADLVQVQKALEGYYTANSSYPTTGAPLGGPCTGTWFGTSVNGGSKTTSGANAYIPNLTGNYLGTLPIDPLHTTTGWSGYNYCSDGISYKLILNDVGPESFPALGELFYDPVRPTTAWMVCSGTTACNNW